MRTSRPAQWFRFGALIAFALCASVARAEHFAITLSLEGGGEKAEAYSDDSPPPEGFHPRPVFHARAGELLTLQFFMTYVNPHDSDKQVEVRFFVMPEKKVGQKEVPSVNGDVVVQGNFIMDFKPKSRVGLKQKFRIYRAGVYLLRLESLNSHSDHQHFSAIDLVIE